jgi:hypothetical protein
MNYSTLVSNIQNFLEDDSTELSNSIDQIISQAEDMIFQRLPSLFCFRGSVSGTLIVGTSEYTIPTARMIRQVSVTDSSSNVVYLNHRLDSYVRDYWPNSSTTATPEMYSTNSSGVA